MYLKAGLFGAILILSGGMLVAETGQLRTLLFVILVAWAAARLYYFFFYVIERYIDPQFRFAGFGAAIVHLFRNR